MSFQIEDGGGHGTRATVTDNRLDVSSRSNPRASYISKTNGKCYSWSHSYDHDAADTILLVANTSTTDLLYIHRIIIGADTSTEYTIHCPAYPTLAGTVVTGVNLNRTSGNTASASAYGDETGNTQANVVEVGFLSGNTDDNIDMDGRLILGYHGCIAVDLVTAGTKGAVTIIGYYEAE